MMTRRLLALALFVTVAGCAGTPSEGDPFVYEDVWLGFGPAYAAIENNGEAACGAAFDTWFPDWGVRGAACTASKVTSAAELLGRAPMAPFESGPHSVGASVTFDLDNAREFGHYDADFVDWLGGAALSDNPLVGAVLQPIYDRYFVQTARMFMLAHRDLADAGYPSAVPSGPLSDYAAFLDGGPVPAGAEGFSYDGTPNGGFSVFAFADRSDALLADIGMTLGNEWEAKYEGNTAYGFWLRRRADGTSAQWASALTDLVQTYDNAWLSGL